MAETRAQYLLRTSEVYRRRRAQALPERTVPAIDLVCDATPPDTARARPQPTEEDAPLPPPGPSFVKRLFPRRLHAREIVLLALVALALSKALFLGGWPR